MTAEKLAILATEGFETEDWYQEKDYGHQISQEDWDEFQSHWTRIREMAAQFRNAPFVDNRPKRKWEDLSPTEKIMHTAIRPMIHNYLDYIKFTRSSND